MQTFHASRRLTAALVAAALLLLSTLGLSMATMSSASAVSVVAEGGSEEPSESIPEEPDPEPSDSPEPLPPSPEPPSPSTDPSPAADDPEPSTPNSNGPSETGTDAAVPTDSTTQGSHEPAESSELGADQVAALSAADVLDLVVIALDPGYHITTQVSAAEVLLGEPFEDIATVFVVAPDGSIHPVDFGVVTFELFGPDDDDCSGTPWAITVDPVVDGMASSGDLIVSQPGVYRFTAELAIFGGEEVVNSPCNAPNESVVVLAPPDPDDDDEGEDSEDDGDGNGKKSHRDADAKAALPNTGASDHLNLIGGTGIALTLAGLTIVAATTRRRGSAHLA